MLFQQEQLDRQRRLIADLRRQLREAEQVKRERDNLLKACDELYAAWNDTRGRDMAGRRSAYTDARTSRP